MKRFVSLALVLMLVFALAVSASAEPSPTTEDYYYMTVETVGAGAASVDPDVFEIGSDGTVTFMATPDDGAEFIRWEFYCEYDVVSGTVVDDVSTDSVVVLKPKSDIHAIAYFTGESKPAKPAKADDGATSPKTGYPLYVVISLMGLAICAGVVATKKIKD